MKKRSSKTENLHFRVSEKEKRALEERANEVNLSLSEYLRMMTTLSRSGGELTKNNIQVAVLCQDIVTHIQEKYACKHDHELSERMEKLWMAF